MDDERRHWHRREMWHVAAIAVVTVAVLAFSLVAVENGCTLDS